MYSQAIKVRVKTFQVRIVMICYSFVYGNNIVGLLRSHMCSNGFVIQFLNYCKPKGVCFSG